MARRSSSVRRSVTLTLRGVSRSGVSVLVAIDASARRSVRIGDDDEGLSRDDQAPADFSNGRVGVFLVRCRLFFGRRRRRFLGGTPGLPTMRHSPSAVTADRQCDRRLQFRSAHLTGQYKPGRRGRLAAVRKWLHQFAVVGAPARLSAQAGTTQLPQKRVLVRLHDTGGSHRAGRRPNRRFNRP